MSLLHDVFNAAYSNFFRDPSKIEILNIIKNSNYLAINQKDEKGNTLSHLILKGLSEVGQHHEGLLTIIEETLKLGADLTIRNNENKTPVEVFLTLLPSYPRVDCDRSVKLFGLVQEYHSDPQSILTFLKLFPFRSKEYFKHQYKYVPYDTDIIERIAINKLSLDSLEVVLKWLNNLKADYKNLHTTQLFKKELEKQIEFLKEYADLHHLVFKITGSKGINRIALLRAMLLNEPPLYSLLNKLNSNEFYTSHLAKKETIALQKFFEEYELNRNILENLSASIPPLSETERVFVNPIFTKFYHLLDDKIKDMKSWNNHLKEIYGIPIEQYQMQENYHLYQAVDKLKRMGLFAELYQHRQEIRNGEFLAKVILIPEALQF